MPRQASSGSRPGKRSSHSTPAARSQDHREETTEQEQRPDAAPGVIQEPAAGVRLGRRVRLGRLDGGLGGIRVE